MDFLTKKIYSTSFYNQNFDERSIEKYRQLQIKFKFDQKNIEVLKFNSNFLCWDLGIT